MAERDLKFDCLDDNYGGLLTPEDVHLFYYDIGIDSETIASFIYEWSDDVENYIKDNDLIIEDCVADSIPLTVSENQMFFTIGDKDGGNKAVAFFRHLRNAFSHYHIGNSGEYYCMKDFKGDGKTVTMIGKIHRNSFKGLIHIFFEQKAKAENDIYNHLYPEM